MKSILWVLCACCFAVLSLPSEADSRSYPWLGKRKIGSSLQSRFRPPRGYVRMSAKKGTFLRWLRGLPLKVGRGKVRLYDGTLKSSQHHHQGIIDIDIGRRDLQQCADAVMRLWGEFLWSAGLQRHASFQFVDGTPNPWRKWSRGYRPRFGRGRVAGWRKRKKANASYRNYRSYLWFVMAWSNTSSMERQLKRIPIAKAKAGDLLLVGWRRGGPGHAVLLVDEAVNRRGEKVFLIAQSYMPAQSIHVLKAPGQSTSPWYRLPKKGAIVTPEWTFSARQVYRLPHLRSTRH